MPPRCSLDTSRWFSLAHAGGLCPEPTADTSLAQTGFVSDDDTDDAPHETCTRCGDEVDDDRTLCPGGLLYHPACMKSAAGGAAEAGQSGSDEDSSHLPDEEHDHDHNWAHESKRPHSDTDSPPRTPHRARNTRPPSPAATATHDGHTGNAATAGATTRSLHALPRNDEARSAPQGALSADRTHNRNCNTEPGPSPGRRIRTSTTQLQQQKQHLNRET